MAAAPPNESCAGPLRVRVAVVPALPDRPRPDTSPTRIKSRASRRWVTRGGASRMLVSPAVSGGGPASLHRRRARRSRRTAHPSRRRSGQDASRHTHSNDEQQAPHLQDQPGRSASRLPDSTRVTRYARPESGQGRVMNHSGGPEPAVFAAEPHAESFPFRHRERCWCRMMWTCLCLGSSWRHCPVSH